MADPADDEPTTVWLDGRLMSSEDARIAPDDRGFLLADGLFETMHAESGQLQWADAHLDRLRRGATALDITLDGVPASDLLHSEVARLLATNDLDGPGTHAAVRLTVSRGVGGRGLDPPRDRSKRRGTVLLTGSPVPHGPGGWPPAALVTSPIRRNPRAPSGRHKLLAYTDLVVARRGARMAGADMALLLNPEGRVACADAANVFAMMEGTLRTPPIAEGALPGTRRAYLIERCRTAGIQVAIQPLARDVLTVAEAVFVTNALVGMRPVTRLDGRAICSADEVAGLRSRLGWP